MCGGCVLKYQWDKHCMVPSGEMAMNHDTEEYVFPTWKCSVCGFVGVVSTLMEGFIDNYVPATKCLGPEIEHLVFFQEPSSYERS